MCPASIAKMGDIRSNGADCLAVADQPSPDRAFQPEA